MKIRKLLNTEPILKTKSKDVNISNLDNNIVEYVKTLEPEYQDMLLATSGNDSKHSKDSRHFKNKAVDFRFNKKLYERIKQDPNRLKYGVTLLDPEHGTAPHLHLSVGNATENKKDVWIDPHSEEAKKEINKEVQEAIEKKIDGVQTVRNIPDLATPSYTPLPETETKKEVEKTQPAITEQQLRKLLEQERTATESRFMEALQRQTQPQYEPQAAQQDLSHLYQIIDINQYEDGGELNCGGEGQPPCPPKEPTQEEIQGINQFIEKTNNQIPKFNPEEDLNFIERTVGKVLLGDTFDEMTGMYNNLVDFKNKRGDSTEMSEEEIDLRTRLKNAQQFKYPSSLQDLEDFTNRAKTGERQLSDNEVHSHKQDLIRQYNTRDALNSKYYGLDYDDKLIKKSEYKPSVGKDDNIDYIDFGDEYKQEQINQIKSKYASFGDLHKKLGKKSNIAVGEKLAFEQLMNFTMGAGEDEKGKYISYYDKWDIDPPMLESRGIDIDKLNNPFEIYGRIYEEDF